jgi:hypothetical protein
MQQPEIEYKKEPKHATSQDMLRLAQENESKGIQTSVYDWKFPKILDAPVLIRDLAPNVMKLRQITLKQNHKNPTWDNDRVRAHLKVKYPEFRDMANRTHPHLFIMLTDKDLTDQNFKRIVDLLAIRLQHEQEKDLEKNTQLISSYFQQEFIPK